MADCDLISEIVQLLKSTVSVALSQISVGTGHGNVKVCKKSRDLKSGDIIVPAGCINLAEAQQNELQDCVQRSMKEKSTYISNVTSNKHYLLAFHLNRALLSRAVFKEIQERGCKYGHAKVQNGRSLFINDVSEVVFKQSEVNSLINLRLQIVYCHIRKLLEAKGYSIISSTKSKDDLDSVVDSCKAIDITSDGNCTKHPDKLDSSLEKHFFEQAKLLFSQCPQEQMKDRSSGKLVHAEEAVIEESHSDCFGISSTDTITLDLQNVVKSKGLFVGKDGFDKNLCKVAVVKDHRPTDVLQDVIRLAGKLQLDSHMKASCACLHLVPQHLAFRQQQIHLTLTALSGQDFQQAQLPVGPVSSKRKATVGTDITKDTAQHFIGTRYKQMKEASEMRYAGSFQDEEQKVSLLTTASIKLDILGTAAHSPLRLDIDCTDRGAESHLGAFVLYNTARLATLMDHFAQGVSRGQYPSLPSVEEVDFSFLREEEDWELVFVYIAAFPDLIAQATEEVLPSKGKLAAKIHTHKVANFLASFCKCLSAHYSRYHILTAGETHLLSQMYARLYLMKSAHQVLLNCLDLIGVEALAYL